MAQEVIQRLHDLDQQAEKWQADTKAAIVAKDKDMEAFAREQLKVFHSMRMELTKQLAGRRQVHNAAGLLRCSPCTADPLRP